MFVQKNFCSKIIKQKIFEQKSFCSTFFLFKNIFLTNKFFVFSKNCSFQKIQFLTWTNRNCSFWKIQFLKLTNPNCLFLKIQFLKWTNPNYSFWKIQSSPWLQDLFCFYEDLLSLGMDILWHTPVQAQVLQLLPPVLVLDGQQEPNGIHVHLHLKVGSCWPSILKYPIFEINKSKLFISKNPIFEINKSKLFI